MATDVQIAWAAGLFEGEGSCFVGSGQRQPIVSLVTTDQDIAERFATIIGIGNVYSYDRPPNKRYWRWSVQSRDDVLRVLGILFPLLGERRQQAASEVIERATKVNDGEGYCHAGHDLSDPQHLYVHQKTGKRHCRTCRDERRRVLRLAA